MKAEEKSYWQNKNVFITGINGFVGGNLAKKLLGESANVFGLVRNKKPNGFLDYESLSDKICLIEGNICDREIVERIISEEKIDIVFHLAAQVEVGVALENPFLTYETNIRGTYSILETIRKYNKNWV